MIKTVNILIILLIYKQDSLPVQRICKEQTAVFHSGGQTTHNRKKAAGPWDRRDQKERKENDVFEQKEDRTCGHGDGRHELCLLSAQSGGL